MTKDEYNLAFGISTLDSGKAKIALEYALDIRKFEIELYWKKATYFWALIAVAFAGYFAVLGSNKINDKEYLSFIIGCVGFLFTWAWFTVNRGSKYWQENWESHVDMLEDCVTGPLFKTVFSRPEDTKFVKRYITGAMTMSAHKTNQWVGIFTLSIWTMLIIHTAPDINIKQGLSYRHVAVVFITGFFVYMMQVRGKTHKGSYDHYPEIRKVNIL